ncbi:MAG TPA: Spy/CpxP family protein refolding chaperone [Methylomirabilota bacterium]|nr:Spy/CpxP family protein refolding chaperone [Methylomirabilota bacterium]
MRTFSFRTAALALAATLLAGVAAYAADAPATPNQHQQRFESRLQQKLGLTDDQVTKLRDIRTRDFAAQRQNWQALHQAQSDLRKLALNGADDATLQAKQTEIQTLTSQSLQARVNGLKEIGSVLTPDQRAAYLAMMDHPRGHHGHRGHGAKPQS